MQPRSRRDAPIRLLLLALTAALVAACADPAAGDPSPTAAPAATAAAAPTSAPPAAAPTAAGAPPTASSGTAQVADFKIVAYQGEATIGGHDGHFSAAFAAGKPVVLLYFGGL